jgi:integrase
MVARMLTAAAVAKLKAAAKTLEIPDAGAPGLRLVIQPTGTKSWAMRFRRPDGKQGNLTLGRLDTSGREADTAPIIGQPLTVAAARALAIEISRQRAKDLDVVAEHRIDKQRRRAVVHERGTIGAFRQAVLAFVDGRKVKKTGQKPRRWREDARMLGLDYPLDGGEPATVKGSLCDRWRDKPIAEINSDDIYHLIEEARQYGVPGLRRRNDEVSEPRGRKMADVLAALFKWLHRHRWIKVNPYLGTHRPPAPAARDRALNTKADVRNADELRWFWAACDAVGQPFGALCKLLLLTGCRRDEIARMTRRELSDDYSMLRLPGERTKNGLPHEVALPPLAREILESVPQIAGCEFMLTTNGRSPISGFSKYKKRLDVAMLAKARKAIPQWQLHDLRRSCATGLGDIGISPFVIEECLNHVSGAKAGVAGTYNRSRYQPETKAALERWAAYVAGVVSGQPANVVPMRGRPNS